MSIVRAWMRRMAGRKNKIGLGAGLKSQSKSMFLFINEQCTRVKKSSIQGFFIIASWHLLLERKSPDPLPTPTCISSLKNYSDNQTMLLNQCRFMVSCTHQRHSSKLIVTSRILLMNRAATFRGLWLVLYLPQIALSWHLSAMLSCGQFILW